MLQSCVSNNVHISETRVAHRFPGKFKGDGPGREGGGIGLVGSLGTGWGWRVGLPSEYSTAWPFGEQTISVNTNKGGSAWTCGAFESLWTWRPRRIVGLPLGLGVYGEQLHTSKSKDRGCGGRWGWIAKALTSNILYHSPPQRAMSHCMTQLPILKRSLVVQMLDGKLHSEIIIQCVYTTLSFHISFQEVRCRDSCYGDVI